MFLEGFITATQAQEAVFFSYFHPKIAQYWPIFSIITLNHAQRL
jgi:hypothetical protein